MSEDNQGAVEVSKAILKEEKKQNRKEGVQTVGITIMTICMVIITVVAVTVFINVNNKINAFYKKADTAITSLNEIATDIQEADLPGMATKIDDLTETATPTTASSLHIQVFLQSSDGRHTNGCGVSMVLLTKRPIFWNQTRRRMSGSFISLRDIMTSISFI